MFSGPCFYFKILLEIKEEKLSLPDETAIHFPWWLFAWTLPMVSGWLIPYTKTTLGGICSVVPDIGSFTASREKVTYLYKEQ